MKCGNIIFTLSEHFSQFVSEDYTSFSSEISPEKFQLNYPYANVHNYFRDFYFKLDGCVDRHAPINLMDVWMTCFYKKT